MKFAKELEREAVPGKSAYHSTKLPRESLSLGLIHPYLRHTEWRIKYLNYKAGKKYVKAVSRAIGRANATPGTSSLRASTFLPPLTPRQPIGRSAKAPGRETVNRPNRYTAGTLPGTASSAQTAAESFQPPQSPEHAALTGSGDNRQYGSFVTSPPQQSPVPSLKPSNDFELPAPALKVNSRESVTPASKSATDTIKRTLHKLDPRRTSSADTVPTASKVSSPMINDPSKRPTESGVDEPPTQLRRLFTHTSTARSERRVDIGMQSFDLVKEREREFFEFLDTELNKVESFYKLKEEQAGQRLDILRIQLHEMRNRRIHEMAEERNHEEHHNGNHSHENGIDKRNGWVNPIKAKIFPPGPNSKALQKMDATPIPNGLLQGNDASRDYIRRPEGNDVPYRTAKRKLKLALQEFYRGLELLKSYALLNRTAFRKLNKKYDKTINARPPYRYLNEKVNKAWFVNSELLECHIRTVEDLYARYFERNNHKLAAGKLRSLTKKPEDQSTSMFQNGLLIGTGAVFAVQGLIYGAQLLFDDDDQVRVQTSFLMQIYGGYFLMLFLFAFFCVDCLIWNQNKINYPFIFEFDQRHHLDWRQLARFPSFFFLVMGMFMWVNFSRYGSPDMYIYYPVVLIFITAVILFFPAPLLWHRSRRWFVYSHVSLTYWLSRDQTNTLCSGVCFSLAYTLSSFEISSLAISTVPSHTPQRYV